MRKGQFCLCATIALHAAFTARAMDDFASLETSLAPLGRLMVTPFATAPFPHPARAQGHRYHDLFFSAAEHYSDRTVALFVPRGFRETGRIDFIVHFHGWSNTVAGTLEQFKLAEQLAGSGKNAILIVPEGPRNALDSFGGRLEDTNGFKAFMAEALQKLRASGALAEAERGLQPASTTEGEATSKRPEGRAPEIGNIILSGHSGGYHVMAAILDHGGLPDKIREAWLFDALYGNTGNFVAWQKHQNGRLLDIYTDHGGTKAETENLMAAYRTNGVSFFAGEDTNATPEDLRMNRLIFLHSDMIHNDVVAKRGTFEQFLKTSCLENK